MRKTWIWVAVVAVGLLLLMPWGLPKAQSEEDDGRVFVTNFPETQSVQGKVSVEAPFSHAMAMRFERVVVVPLARRDVADNQPVGVVETEGFTRVVISLQGEVTDKTFSPGAVGVLMVPDEEPVMRALRDGRKVEFPLESAASPVAGEGGFFAGEPKELPVAFPRYRVYLYNTMNRGAEVNLYLYLTN